MADEREYYARHTGVYILQCQAVAAVREWMRYNKALPHKSKAAPIHRFYGQTVHYIATDIAEVFKIDGMMPERWALHGISEDALLAVTIERCPGVLARCPFTVLWKEFNERFK
jgi:hypothetical protein